DGSLKPAARSLSSSPFPLSGPIGLSDSTCRAENSGPPIPGVNHRRSRKHSEASRTSTPRSSGRSRTASSGPSRRMLDPEIDPVDRAQRELQFQEFRRSILACERIVCTGLPVLEVAYRYRRIAQQRLNRFVTLAEQIEKGIGEASIVERSAT